MSKKSNRLYALSLALYCLLILAAILFIMFFLWKYAAAYEASLPTTAIDQYMQTLTREKWRSLADPTLNEVRNDLQTEDSCFDYIMTYVDKGVKYTRASGGSTDGSVRYNIICDPDGDNFQIGTVSLKKDPEAQYPFLEQFGYGLHSYSPESENYDFSFIFGATEITIPKEYTVYLNGSLVDSTYIVEDNIQYEYLKDFYDGTDNMPYLCRYAVDSVFGDVELTVRDENGNPFEITKETKETDFLHDADSEQTVELTTYTKNFVEQYLYYSCGIGDGTAQYFNTMAYVKGNTKLAERLKLALDGKMWSNTSYLTIKSIDINDIVKITESDFLVDVSYSCTAYLTSGVNEIDESFKILISGNPGSYMVTALKYY